MTVKELIAELQKMPEDMEVVIPTSYGFFTVTSVETDGAFVYLEEEF